MLYAIHSGYAEQYREGQRPVIHLTSPAESISEIGLAFTFTEGHAELAYSAFYEDLADLDKIDWQVMKSRRWNDTVEDMDRKRRRQAEFLVHNFFPWELVTKIGVIDNGEAEHVNEILQGAAHRPTVEIKGSWYY